MRAQVIEQPNGLLCVFDPNVEGWVLWDMTPEELTEFYKDEAARKAEQVVTDIIRAVTRDDPRTIYGSQTLSFEEANARHLANDGNEIF